MVLKGEEAALDVLYHDIDDEARHQSAGGNRDDDVQTPSTRIPLETLWVSRREALSSSKH